MEGWSSHMPRGMYLKSTVSASSLSSPEPGATLADYLRGCGSAEPAEHDPVPLDAFVAYGRWFQQTWVPRVEPVRVLNVARAGRGFSLTLSSGEVESFREVIIATGHVPHAYVPQELALHWCEDLTDGLVSHSCQHRDLGRFAGRHVAVVGAGQSALETATLLCEAGATVQLIARAASLRWGQPPVAAGAATRLARPEAALGSGWSNLVVGSWPGAVHALPRPARHWIVRAVLGPAGAWWLRERFDGRIAVSLATRIRHSTVTDDRVRLQLDTPEGQAEAEVDHVIAATGYRPEVASLELLDPALRDAVASERGWPKLSATFESSVPGLRFVGLITAGAFGPAMRFVHGTSFTARRVARSLRVAG